MKLTLNSAIVILISCLVLTSCSKKNHPPLVRDQEFSIAENSVNGTNVGQVIAMDEDNDMSLTYAILSGNKSDAFEISSTDGSIKIHNEDVLDFETNPSFTLVVEVKDSKGAKSSSDIKINLTDVVPPTAGLLLYYPFDGTVNDAGPNNNNGINHTTGNYVTGRWGQGLDFNGTSDYIQLTNTIGSSTGLSFSFWIKSRGAAGTENNGVIICKYNMTLNTRCFIVYSFESGLSRSNNRLSAAFYKYGYSSAVHDNTKSYFDQNELSLYPSDPLLWTLSNPMHIQLDTWTHCIVNMTSASLEIWLNGVLCTKKQREYSLYYDTQTEPVYIGNNMAMGDGTNNHYNGVLDELRIYNRPFTTTEIKTLFKER